MNNATQQKTIVSKARAVALAFLLPALAMATVVEVRWAEDGRFEHHTTVPPGKFAEACVPLAADEAVAWEFKASANLAFNIHHHEGKAVIYSERRPAAAQLKGTLQPKVAQEYCWMWSNKGSQPAALELRLKRGG